MARYFHEPSTMSKVNQEPQGNNAAQKAGSERGGGGWCPGHNQGKAARCVVVG